MIYADEEIRLTVLPLAMQMLNQEVYRTLQQCNTTTIQSIVNELTNIVKYGTISLPVTPSTESTGESGSTDTAQPNAGSANVEPAEMRYA